MQNGFEPERELAKLKSAYGKLKDTMIYSYLTEQAFAETVAANVDPQRELALVWLGFKRMQVSRTPRQFLPPLHRFLRERRYLETWTPREAESLGERIQNL